MRLTDRARSGGFRVPSGNVRMKVRNKEGVERHLIFVWRYTPEYVPTDVPVRNMIFAPANHDPRLAAPTHQETPATASSSQATLGKTIANIASEWNPGYIFRLPKGHVVGFLRIPTFKVEKVTEAADDFGNHIASLDQTTDALVIDLTNNGGGSMTYMYGLLSRLTDHPLATLPQQVMVSSDMAAESAQRLTMANLAQSDEEAHKVVGSTPFPGMNFGSNDFLALVNCDRFIFSELKAGRRLTEPTAFLGISSINPHPTQHYSKPILVLVDELDFSAGDFFPAILQDNKRAKIFGVRTACAGGAVIERQLPNQFNIKSLGYTWTIAQRLNGDPLENVGVTPDIPYTLTVKDLTNGYEGYRAAIISAVEQMLARNS